MTANNNQETIRQARDHASHLATLSHAMIDGKDVKADSHAAMLTAARLLDKLRAIIAESEPEYQPMPSYPLSGTRLTERRCDDYCSDVNAYLDTFAPHSTERFECNPRNGCCAVDLYCTENRKNGARAVTRNLHTGTPRECMADVKDYAYGIVNEG